MRQEGSMLFSERSIWTMVHGIGLGGGALIGLAAAWFYLYAARSSDGAAAPPGSGALAGATGLGGGLLWLPVIVGAYVILPPCRPRPSAAGRPAFAMESKEHMPWIASMLTTAVAFVAVRYRSRVLQNSSLRSLSMALLAISFALVAFVSLMGLFVNKVAPLD